MYKKLLRFICMMQDFVITKVLGSFMCPDISELEAMEFVVMSPRKSAKKGPDELIQLNDLKFYLKKKDRTTSKKEINNTTPIGYIAFRFWLFTAEARRQLYLVHKSLMSQSSARFKSWQDANRCFITLLFGLSNAHSADIFSAIFGTSSYQIHA